MTNVREARSFGFFLLSVLALFLSIIYITNATSIGANISADGTLSVGSTLTVTGASTFTGAVTLNGAGTFGDAASDNFLFTGGLMASSTLGVTGTTFLYGNINHNGFATTTAASGNLRTEGNIGIATTTSMTSNVYLGVQGTGTTTIAIGTSGGTNVGSCIQLRGLDGQSFRVFAAATTSVTKQLVVEVGSCNGN